MKVLLATIAVLSTSAALAQTIIRVDLTDPRPLVQAMDQVEPGLFVPINFEEVRMENKADIVDVQTLMTPADIGANPSYHLIVCRGGRFTATVAVVPDGSVGEASIVVGALLAAYAAEELPGGYEMVVDGSSVYVLPAKVLSAAGKTKDADSPLSHGVSIVSTTVPFEQALDVLAQSISLATGYAIKVITPFPIHDQVTLAAAGEPGRVVLSRIVSQLQPLRLSYRGDCGGGDTGRDEDSG